MSRERGWMGWLFMLALAGGAWYVWGYGPILSNDYKMRNVMKSALGDYIVFTVNEDGVESSFRKRCEEQGVDTKGVDVRFSLDEGQRNWASARVTYARQWSLPFMKKVYTKKFDWEKKVDR